MNIPTTVRDAVVNAFYPRAVALPDAARSRAQAAYGIASAIAAALVAAGVFSDFGQRDASVKTLGVMALVAWFAAAILFMITVAAPLTPHAETQRTADAFVRKALEAARTEKRRIDALLVAAGSVTLLAALLTLATFITAAFTPSGERSTRVTLQLSKVGQLALVSLCERSAGAISGRMKPSALEKEFVRLDVDKRGCAMRAVTLWLPRADVEAVRSR
jgi:MFS family permease